MEQELMSFGEAWNLLEQGKRITNETGREYVIEDNNIVCYSSPSTNPEHRYVVNKFFTDVMRSKGWRIVN